MQSIRYRFSLFLAVIGVQPINRTTIKVSAEAQYTQDNFDVSYIFDGNVNTSAASCGCCGAVPNKTWIEIELSSRYLLDHIVIKGRSDSKANLKFRYL